MEGHHTGKESFNEKNQEADEARRKLDEERRRSIKESIQADKATIEKMEQEKEKTEHRLVNHNSGQDSSLPGQQGPTNNNDAGQQNTDKASDTPNASITQKIDEQPLKPGNKIGILNSQIENRVNHRRNDGIRLLMMI